MSGLSGPTINASQHAYEEALTAETFNTPPSQIASHLSPEEFILVFHHVIDESFFFDDLDNLFATLEVYNENVNTTNRGIIYIEE